MKLLSTSQDGKTPFITTLIITLCVTIYFIFVWLYLGEFNWSKWDWLSTGYLNLNMWLFLLIPFAVPICSAFGIRFFIKKWVGFDILPLSLSLIIGWNIVILTGMMINSSSQWIVVARIVIVIVSFIICFLFINRIINLIIIHSRFGASFFSQQYNEVAENKENSLKVKETWGVGKKDRKRFIEIPVEEDQNKKKE